MPLRGPTSLDRHGAVQGERLQAVGPICVAFAAHEKTESYFWGFLKAFLFVGLLYMPLLGLACGWERRGAAAASS